MFVNTIIHEANNELLFAFKFILVTMNLDSVEY